MPFDRVLIRLLVRVDYGLWRAVWELLGTPVRFDRVSIRLLVREDYERQAEGELFRISAEDAADQRD